MRRRDPARRRRRRSRGAVAIEFALALPSVMLVMVTGIHFGHAMIVRHKLAHATHHATRICAVQRGNPGGCVRDQLETAMGDETEQCQPNIQIREESPGGIDVLTVTASCQYRGGFAQLVEQEAPDQGVFPLSVTASFPRQ